MSARHLTSATLVAAAIGLAACSSKSNITPAVTKLNALGATQHVRFECPKEVDSKVGTRFSCDLVGPTGKRKTLGMKVSAKGTIDVVDSAALHQAISAVQ
jgi:uncharacterized lipoprotein